MSVGIVKEAKSFIDKNFTFTEETHDKIRETLKKIIEYMPLIFFGLTVLFSYFVAPASAFEYLNHLGYSLKSVFVEGAVFGTTVLILKNLFITKPLTKTQDDKINCLAGLANIGQTFLSPTYGLVNSIALAGFISIKTIFNHLFTKKDQKIYVLIQNDDLKK